VAESLPSLAVRPRIELTPEEIALMWQAARPACRSQGLESGRKMNWQKDDDTARLPFIFLPVHISANPQRRQLPGYQRKKRGLARKSSARERRPSARRAFIFHVNL
jgi:hypothetical protein